MVITFLGTGSAPGVPMIGCKCRVCKSNNPKNKRLRQSIWLTEKGFSLLIDATPDLRYQILKYNIKKIDAILLTHPHSDHILGLDETRIFSFKQNRPIPLYGTRFTLLSTKKTFWYALNTEVPLKSGLPEFTIKEINDKPFNLGPFNIEVLKGEHGISFIDGFKINNICYMTDFKEVPEETIEKAKKCKILIIGALSTKEHFAHLSLKEALFIIEKIAPQKAYLVHLGHKMDYDKLISILPKNVLPAFDGLKIRV